MTILPKHAKAITVRLTESDSLAIHARALRAGLSLSAYARRAMLGQLDTVPAQPTAAAPVPTLAMPLAAPTRTASRYLVSSSDGDDPA